MTTCACGNCQFFDTHSGHSGASAKQAAAPQKDAEAGLCRFNPPLPQQGSNTRGQWPVVGKKDWCGHFAATVERFMTAAA